MKFSQHLCIIPISSVTCVPLSNSTMMYTHKCMMPRYYFLSLSSGHFIIFIIVVSFCWNIKPLHKHTCMQCNTKKFIKNFFSIVCRSLFHLCLIPISGVTCVSLRHSTVMYTHGRMMLRYYFFTWLSAGYFIIFHCCCFLPLKY